MSNPLYYLSSAGLRALASSLKTGVLSHGISASAIEQIVGSKNNAIAEYFGCLEKDGFSKAQIATLINAVAETKDFTPSPEQIFELVLSGPDVPGIHTCDTAATMRTMIENANHDLIMVGYALHNIQSLFKPIAEKLETIPGFKVIFCLDIGRTYGDTSLESEIIRRFITEFKERHWPWPKMPEIFYDPRSLETGTNAGHSSLHAKCIITDHKVALVTSANFTEAAQYRNIEAGVQIKHLPMVMRLAGYFEGLIEKRLMLPCVL